jgi:hypothetical protein
LEEVPSIERPPGLFIGLSFLIVYLDNASNVEARVKFQFFSNSRQDRIVKNDRENPQAPRRQAPVEGGDVATGKIHHWL